MALLAVYLLRLPDCCDRGRTNRRGGGRAPAGWFFHRGWGIEHHLAAPGQKLLNQLRFRLEPADALGGFRDQFNQEFIGSFDDLGPGCGDGFADNLGPLLRFDQGFGIANRLSGAHPFRRKVLQEPVFHDVGLLDLEVDGQEPSLFPIPRLQGQIEPLN